MSRARPRPGGTGCGVPEPVPFLALEVAVAAVRIPGPARQPVRRTPALPVRPTSSGPGCGAPAPCGWRPRTDWSSHSTTGINDSRDGFYVSSTRKSWLLPPQLVTPVYDDGGLVRRRPEAAYGEPSLRQRPLRRRPGPGGTRRKRPGTARIPQRQRRGTRPHRRGGPRGPARPGNHRHPQPRLPPRRSRGAAVPPGTHPAADRRRHRSLRREPLAGRTAARPATATGSGSWPWTNTCSMTCSWPNP